MEAVGGGVAEPSNKEEEALLPPAMTPIAGHALAMWGDSILCIGGHTKVSMLTINPYVTSLGLHWYGSQAAYNGSSLQRGLVLSSCM